MGHSNINTEKSQPHKITIRQTIRQTTKWPKFCILKKMLNKKNRYVTKILNH